MSRENILVGAAEVFVDGVNVGWTEGGVEVEKSFDVYEKEVDQKHDAVDLVATKTTLTVKTQLAEATLENLKRAWNEMSTITDDPTKRTLGIGIQETFPEHTLEFRGKAPTGNQRVYKVWRAFQVGASAHGLRKADKVVFPVEFRCLPDLDKPETEQYGQVIDYK